MRVGSFALTMVKLPSRHTDRKAGGLESRLNSDNVSDHSRVSEFESRQPVGSKLASPSELC